MVASTPALDQTSSTTVRASTSRLVADIARLDGGPESVRGYLPKVKAALRFLQELRERTLVPGYKADQPSPEQFAGILAPSISHEGYPRPPTATGMTTGA